MAVKQTDFFRKPSVVILLAIVCILFWSSAASFIKVGYAAMEIDQNHIPSLLLFAGCRFAITGSMILWIFSFLQRKPMIPKSKREGKQILVLCFFETIMQYVPYYIGLTRTSGTTAAIIHGCNGFTTILVAAFLFRSEKMTTRKICGCALGICAVLLMNYSGLRHGIKMTLGGEGLLVLAQMGYVIGVNLTKEYGKSSDPILLTGWQFILGGIVLAMTGKLLGGQLVLTNFKAAGILGYLSIYGAIAYALWSILLKFNEVSRIAVFNFLIPLFGIFFSVLMLQEASQAFDPATIGALALTFLGIQVASGKTALPTHLHEMQNDSAKCTSTKR